MTGLQVATLSQGASELHRNRQAQGVVRQPNMTTHSRSPVDKFGISHEAFKAWFEHERQMPTKHLWELMPDTRDISWTMQLPKILDEAATLINRHLKAAENLEVVKWLKSQECFNRSERKMFANSALFTLDQFTPRAEQEREQFCHWAATTRVIKNVDRKLKARLLLRPLKGGWHSRLIHALHEYLCSDYAYELVNASRTFPKLLTAAQLTLNDLIQLILQTEREGIVAKPSKLIRTVAALEIIRDHSLHLPPLRRSVHSKEHLFIYRLYLANRAATRGRGKPDVIVELMALKGFAHQFDARSVERTIAKYKTSIDPATLRKKATFTAGAI